MLDQEAINQKQQEPAMYRRTLAYQIQQAAAHGSGVFAPSVTANGILVLRT
jgi:hypothetical protein